MFVQFMENKYVKYSFIYNGILLTTDEIKKDTKPETGPDLP